MYVLLKPREDNFSILLAAPVCTIYSGLSVVVIIIVGRYLSNCMLAYGMTGVLHVLYYCSYEPELFPGLIYRMVKPKIVLLIFVSGKVVLTGKSAQCRNDDIV